jgi:hypothetical protein
VRAQNAVDRVGEVLRLQIGKLALLLAQLHIEQVVVDLRDQRLQRNAVLHPRRAYHRRNNIARIDKARRSQGDGIAVSSK